MCKKQHGGDGSFEARKQHSLRSYFDLSSTEELEIYLVSYQHTSVLLTMDCTTTVKHTPQLDCDVTENETNKREKPNGVSNLFY